jgi:hypothetical protein
MSGDTAGRVQNPAQQQTPAQEDRHHRNTNGGDLTDPRTFAGWLRRQIMAGREDDVGELAWTMIRDTSWPEQADLQELQRHLMDTGGTTAQQEALDAAWLEWWQDHGQAQEHGHTLATLPESFWSARPTLEHIRQAAHARGRSGDMVLGAVLARLSAMVDPGLRLETPLGTTSLNLFVAAIGRSGTGKSSGSTAAKELIPVPPYLQDPDAFRDGLPVGTGEGLVESFYGTVTEETGELTAKGKPKLERVRKQVRSHVFVFVDEGQNLVAQMERSGSTIGPILRSAWTGELAGQANARDETTRILPAGSYSLGVVIGFQRATAGPLLDDAGAGTPQRFVWLSTTDPTVPDEPPEHPGQLQVPGLVTAANPGDAFAKDHPRTGRITFAKEIGQELWQANLIKVRGLDHDQDEDQDHDLDSHAGLLRCKVAGLLALLDQRQEVNLDDWRLAGQLLDTSQAVRQNLVQFRDEMTAQEEERRADTYVNRMVRAEVARKNADEAVERVAQLLARKIASKGDMTRRNASKLLNSRDRGLFADALELAKDKGWLELDDDDRTISSGGELP